MLLGRLLLRLLLSDAIAGATRAARSCTALLNVLADELRHVLDPIAEQLVVESVRSHEAGKLVLVAGHVHCRSIRAARCMLLASAGILSLIGRVANPR